MGWIFYGVGFLSVNMGFGELGALIISIGMLTHWKYWVAGLIGFTLGVKIK